MDKLVIVPGKTYRIKKGSTSYFLQKYGTPNPEIIIEGTDKEVFGASWQIQTGNPACMLYGMRSGFESHMLNGSVFYGKVNGMGELVHETELEELLLE